MPHVCLESAWKHLWMSIQSGHLESMEWELEVITSILEIALG